ncbi:MAG: RibD family protein [Wenzhouxiangella sp.]|nr:MAG: RibD family protein [Wenzhouxiangella sp.]
MLGDAEISVRRGGSWLADPAISSTDRDLLDALLPLAAWPGRLAIAQLGQSLDGRIATESGDSWYINGREARTHLHRLRALVDAVLVGAGTAAEDRPNLTVRHVAGADPVPVILDPRGRVEPKGPLFEGRSGAPATLHLVGEGVRLPRPPPGVERVQLACTGGEVAPQLVLERLAERGLKRVLVEGGGVTVSRFVAADSLDRLHLLIAPLIIGSGRPGLKLPPIARLSEARRPPIRSFPLADELLVDVRFR